MTRKITWILILAAVLILGAAGFFSWLHVDGTQLPLPEGQDITGYVTRLDIGFDAENGTATHDSVSADMTDAQVADFLQLLRGSSYRRTRYGNSVSFDGDAAYTISLGYREGGKTKIQMISVLGNDLLCVDPADGYLRITDSEFLTRLQAILEN